MKRQYKTGKTQRDAVKAYRERTPQKNFCVTVSAEQYEKDKSTLTAHGLTTGKFWRWAIEKLQNEPTDSAGGIVSTDPQTQKPNE